MLVTRTLQTRFARAGAIDQMFNDQVGRRINGQLRQRQRGTQEFSDVGQRERRQFLDAKFASQLRVSRMPLTPVEQGLSAEPRRQTDQGQARVPRQETFGRAIHPIRFRSWHHGSRIR